MSQWNHPPSGSNRRSDFVDHERPGSYRFPLPQHSQRRQSSEASISPNSSQEGRTSKAVGQLPSLTAGIGIFSDVVGTRVDAAFLPSSSTVRLPTPSPASCATFTLPPIALSSPRLESYTSPSANLSHKLGTDNLSTQTLQHENADLASAYAQAQIYIADLDTRFQASHAENGRLVKERQRLMGKIELLEAQLEELEHTMQEAQRHTAAKDVQYSRIMELSARLQSQGAAEQHEWSCEKKSMQHVIESLSNEVNGLRKAYATFTNLTPPSIGDCPNMMEVDPDSAAESSSHGLLAEVESLRRTNARMGHALAGVRGDNAQLAEYIEKLGRVENNIQLRLQRAETVRGTLDIGDGEEATGKERELTAKG